MKALLASTILSVLALALSISAFGDDSWPTDKQIIQSLNDSAVLKGVKAGVKTDYGMQTCSSFKITAPLNKDRVLKARATCVYKDTNGEGESGILIDVEASFYEGVDFMLNNIAFTFAG